MWGRPLLFILLPSLIAASTICPNNTGMQDHQIQKFLIAHNLRRLALAQGKIVKRNLNRLPSASNMLLMKYNCTLEANAITQAQLCVRTGSGRTDIGENIASISRTVARSKLEGIEKAVSSWWKQSRGPVNIGPQAFYRSHHSAAAEFVRMAWARTDQLGCAIAKCSTFFSVICQYNQPGPTVGERIYEPGTPCTSCPSGTNCTQSALCT